MNWKSLIFNVKQLGRPASRSLLSELYKTERLSLEEIMALNWRRRIQLLNAATRSPFYRRRFSEIGLSVGDVKTEKDWEHIPILTRQDIQNHMEEMVCDGVSVSSLSIASTGGSTGEPLRLYRTKNIPYDAFATRMMNWWGVEMWENSGYIFRHGYSGWRRVLNDLKWWPTRRVFLNAGNMDSEKCESYRQKINAIKPSLLVGYVGAISAYADFLIDHHYSVPVGLKAVWTTSSPLPEPLRNHLQGVFDAPVYSQYGCCECAHLAAECGCRCGMHINSDWRHLEFVGTDGRNLPFGEVGNVLITDMFAQNVPLIRYALGDRGRMMSRTCSCGINLPLMAPVMGRISESFPMPDGSQLSGDYLTTLFDNYPDAIRGFCVHQNKDYSIQVKYVKRNTDILMTALADVHKNLVALTKNQISIDFVSVDAIPHDGGKTRYVTTEIRAK